MSMDGRLFGWPDLTSKRKVQERKKVRPALANVDVHA
jgi:hypothetical protein